MAKRPAFIPLTEGPLVRVQMVDFTWHAGMSMQRKQMSMRSLHEALQELHPGTRALEVSRMSDEELGEKLSAFNLTFTTRGQGREISVECAFQASKVFERGGPYTDLLDGSSLDAKRDPRLQESGRLTSFRFFGDEWPTEPTTAFYDWIYIKALHSRPELAQAVLGYDMFTDIAFNPEKSLNCQAAAVALYVALVRRGLVDTALSSKAEFLKVETGARTDEMIETQPRLF